MFVVWLCTASGLYCTFIGKMGSALQPGPVATCNSPSPDDIDDNRPRSQAMDNIFKLYGEKWEGEEGEGRWKKGVRQVATVISSILLVSPSPPSESLWAIFSSDGFNIATCCKFRSPDDNWLQARLQRWRAMRTHCFYFSSEKTDSTEDSEVKVDDSRKGNHHLRW